MAPRFITDDGNWRLSVISLTGRQLLRLECRRIEDVPLRGSGAQRVGVIKGPGGWYWVADLAEPATVERYIPLAAFSEVNDPEEEK